ncbi:MAG: hypothetical protein HOK41_04550 [Nitrospina sp.]|jgi:hypothetical protein|nr:hypothetical protein [Nitrospina sp.]
MLKNILVVVFLFAPSLSFSEEMKLFLEESKSSYLSIHQQDCSVHKVEYEGNGVGLKFGTYLFGVGPEITWSKGRYINWHPNIQNLIVRYEKLCQDLNSGLLTKEEYTQRLSGIESISFDYGQIRYAREELLFKELDKALE